jgi:bla regulator protein BlaR1
MTRQLSVLALSAVAWAQGPAFEVASVRPANPAAKRPDIRRDPAGGFRAANVDLRTLIVLAYNIQDYQLADAPGWIKSERYDVVAKAPADASKSDTWPMLRALLAERFHLEVHRELKESTVYDLEVAKSGLKIHAATRAPAEADDWCRQGAGHLQCYMIRMDNLAMTLSGAVKRRVYDRTGIDAKFDLTLDWAPDNLKDEPMTSDRPSIFTALQEQLGLRLKAGRAPVEMIVVDHVEKASMN